MKRILISALVVSSGCQDHGLTTFNNDPTAIIVSHSDGAELAPGSMVSFRGSLSDPDTAPLWLRATWLRDGEVICPEAAPDEQGVTTCEIEITPTTRSISLEGRDDQNAVAFSTIEVIVCGETYFVDQDGDGFGSSSETVVSCTEPAGFVDNDDDCNDDDDDISPEAEELCGNEVDDNCNENVDEGCLGTNCFDETSILTNFDYFKTVGQLTDTGADIAGAYIHDYEFEGVAGMEFGVHIWSEAFDGKIELYDPDCELYDFASDGARRTNPFFSARVPSDGIWTLVVTTDVPGEVGDYVMEILEDSAPLGVTCALDTDSMDLESEPYTDEFFGTLNGSDSLFPSSVGWGFYFDDIEFRAFYGDTVTLDHVAVSFNAVLNLYDPLCNLLTYDTNSGEGNNARITHKVERTGNYTATPWAESSWSTGNYTLTGSATF